MHEIIQRKSGRFTGTGRIYFLCGHFSIFYCSRNALRSRQVEPHVRLDIILRHALAFGEQESEVVLRAGVALVNGEAVPLHRLSVALRRLLRECRVIGRQSCCAADQLNEGLIGAVKTPCQEGRYVEEYDPVLQSARVRGVKLRSFQGTHVRCVRQI